MLPCIRPPAQADLDRLEQIENRADTLLTARLHPDSWPLAITGAVRATMPGFLLVLAPEPGADAVGFVHVLEVDGRAHLEQLSVLPESGRRGFGRSLVQAAKDAAAERGHRDLTLRTYADVPWNAPFYATCGFVESAPDAPFLRELAAEETRAGLDRWGRRVQMTAQLR